MAEWFENQFDGVILLIYYIIFFLGLCLALLIRRPRAPMTRLPYLFACLGVFLILLSSEALDLWVFTLFVRLGMTNLDFYVVYLAVTYLIFGAIWGDLAIRRSLDCSGTRQHTLLAMVPLLQIFLAIAPSKSPPSAPKFPEVAGLSPRVSTGIFLVVAAIYAVGADFYAADSLDRFRRFENTAELPRYEPNSPAQSGAPETALWAENLAYQQVLSHHVEELNAELPAEVQEDLIFTKAQVDGRVLRYDYMFDLEVDDTFVEAYREVLENDQTEVLCDGPERVLLDHGVIMVQVFSDRSGEERIVYRVDAERCQ